MRTTTSRPAQWTRSCSSSARPVAPGYSGPVGTTSTLGKSGPGVRCRCSPSFRHLGRSPWVGLAVLGPGRAARPRALNSSPRGRQPSVSYPRLWPYVVAIRSRLAAPALPGERPAWRQRRGAHGHPASGPGRSWWGPVGHSPRSSRSAAGHDPKEVTPVARTDRKSSGGGHLIGLAASGGEVRLPRSSFRQPGLSTVGRSLVVAQDELSALGLPPEPGRRRPPVTRRVVHVHDGGAGAARRPKHGGKRRHRPRLLWCRPRRLRAEPYSSPGWLIFDRSGPALP